MDFQTPDQPAQPLSPKSSRIISSVLSPALRIWLKSQTTRLEDLLVNIEGQDRQILTGYIPQVSISARHAVYQGLHLSQIQLRGTNIRVNLGQVLKGKPLRLLEPIPVRVQLMLEEADLTASLQSPLLSNALSELLETLLAAGERTNSAERFKDQKISWQNMNIDPGQLILSGSWAQTNTNPTPIRLRTGLERVSGHELQLTHIQIETAAELPPLELESFQLDLGSEVEIEELALTSGQLICRGNIQVIPIPEDIGTED